MGLLTEEISLLTYGAAYGMQLSEPFRGDFWKPSRSFGNPGKTTSPNKLPVSFGKAAGKLLGPSELQRNRQEANKPCGKLLETLWKLPELSYIESMLFVPNCSDLLTKIDLLNLL